MLSPPEPRPYPAYPSAPRPAERRPEAGGRGGGQGRAGPGAASAPPQRRLEQLRAPRGWTGRGTGPGGKEAAEPTPVGTTLCPATAHPPRKEASRGHRSPRTAYLSLDGPAAASAGSSPSCPPGSPPARLAVCLTACLHLCPTSTRARKPGGAAVGEAEPRGRKRPRRAPGGPRVKGQRE